MKSLKRHLKFKERMKSDLKYRVKFYIYLSTFFFASTPLIVFADVDATWNIIFEVILNYIPKIGILLIVFGGVEFAIANSNEDANQKLRATRFATSGAIVLAVIEILKPYLLN